MRKRIFLRILLGLTLIVFIVFAAKTGLEIWLEKKIESELKNIYGHTISIKSVNINILSSLLDLKRIKIFSDPKKNEYYAEIRSIKLSGLNYIDAILHKNIHIDEIIIRNSSFNAKIPMKEMLASPIISPFNIDIGRITISQFNIELKNDSTGQAISLKNGSAIIDGIRFAVEDTISPGSLNLTELKAGELNLISRDKMYSYKLKRIDYSLADNTLTADSLLVRPRLTGYEFTSRFRYQKNCFMAKVSKIRVHDFYIDKYFRPLSIASSCIDLGEVNLNVFRDNRKEFLHKRRPALQDMIYNIPMKLKIDSIKLAKGKLTYEFHPENASEPETVIVNGIHAGMLNLTNDNLYKTKKGYLEIKADGMLMGKSKLSILLKGKLYDKSNTLSVTGSLQKLDISDYNPILEKNAFIYASGKVDELKFSFITNNLRAKGRVTMLYDGLQITVRGKRSGDTTSLKTRLFSSIANRKILDSNPSKGEDVRVGIIDYERDPERFLFHYCFRSILTGVSSTLVKNDKKTKRFVLIK